MENTLAGILLFGTASVYLCAYVPLLIALFRLSKTKPTFMIFLSSSIGDFTGMLRLAIFRLSILMKSTIPHLILPINHLPSD